MKISKNKSRVTIEIYDADGEMREAIGGQYTFLEIRDMMRDITQNDGIPVIRQLGKHEAKEPEKEPVFEKDPEWELLNLPKFEIIPMVLEYEFDGIKFKASGLPLDVHCANEALLKRVFEEEK